MKFFRHAKLSVSLPGKRRFAALAGTEQGDDTASVESSFENLRDGGSLNHADMIY
jgi:hypothetical protein